MKLRPVRSLHGLCLYCGRPSRTDVCGYCSHLPVRDPLVAKARQVLSEAERIEALGPSRLPDQLGRARLGTMDNSRAVRRVGRVD